MATDDRQSRPTLFHFNWAAFDTAAGIKYAVGIIVVYVLSSAMGGSWFIAGVGALLCWLTNVPGGRKNRVIGMLCYAVIGSALTFVAGFIGTELWLLILAIFAVTFIGTLPMLKGPRPFMVGWCIIYWFLLTFVLIDPKVGAMDTVLSLLTGSAVVIALTLAGAAIKKSGQADHDSDVVKDGPEIGQVVGYALTVAATMAICIGIGGLVIETDYTWVANAAFMVIGPSSRQTLVTGIDRAVGATFGIIAGFYLFQYLQDATAIFVIGVALSYLSLSLMNVSAAAFTFFFLIYMSFDWAQKGVEEANFIANERIVAEIGGVLIAIAAVGLLQWWTKKSPKPGNI
jgi:Fusaric acid resistance protein-like